MTRSMTGYAQSSTKTDADLSWTVEIHAVNRRTLELHLHLPRELLFLDTKIRKSLASQLHRGQINLRIHHKRKDKSQISVALLKKQKTYWMKIAKELKLSTEGITLPFLLEQTDRLAPEEVVDPKAQTEILKTVEKTLSDMVHMRESEGKALAADILKRLKILAGNTEAIEKLTAKSPAAYRKKMLKKLEDLIEEAARDERVLKEIAVFAEKADVTEEITRLKSHIQQMQDLLKLKDKSIGRTLDFLTQEMLREINTIASKSSELSVSQKAVASKAELEKIREQVQNIE